MGLNLRKLSRSLSPKNFKLGSLLRKGGSKLKVSGSKLGSKFKLSGGKFGSNIKRGSGKLGKNIKKGSKQVGENIKKGSKQVGENIKKGSKQVGKNIKKGSKQVGKNIKKGAGELGSNLKKGTGKLSSRAVKKCRENPAKCTVLVAAAAYTAHTFVENSVQQRECITDCLPENWAGVVDHGENPEFYDSDDDTDEQPKCTSDMNTCESMCQSRCEKLHPKTLGGTMKEGVGELVADVAGFAEDALGIPVTAMKRGIALFVGIVTLLVLHRIYRAIFGKESGAMSIQVSGMRETVIPNKAASKPPDE